MQCVFEPHGEASEGDQNDLTVTVSFACRNCGFNHKSKYPPNMIHRQCVSAQPGGIITRLSRYARAIKRWTEAGKPVRTDEQVATIFAICQSCEHFDAARNKCELCRCRLNVGKNARFNKIRMATENCPDEPARW